MSELPKIENLPSPKTATGNRDYTSPEHEALMRLVWSRLDVGVERLFGWKSAKIREQSKGAIAAFEASLESVANMLGSMAARAGESDELHAKLIAVKERVERSEVSSTISPWPKNIAAVEVLQRELTKALTEERQAGTVRAHNEVVGYVDFSIDLKAPVRMALEGNMPSCLIREREELWRDPLKLMRLDARKAEQILALDPATPSWACAKEEKQVWIDVRVTCPPLGQMLREVRVLKSLSAKKVTLVMVLPEVDPELDAMLANEKVVATSHKWWHELSKG